MKISRKATVPPPNSAPASRPPETQAPPDHVELSADAEFQKKKRMATDATLVALGDVPAGISIAVGLNALPALEPFSDGINAFNSLTGYLGLASDLSVARDCLNNPDAPKIDKVVDAAHIASDVVNTGASMVPLFCSLSNPVALGVFIGGQALGAACDVAKSIWDYKRGGAQSSRADADQPEHLVLDSFEQKAGRIPMLLGTLAANSMAFHTGAPLLASLAQPLTAIGGAFGGVYGATQIKKSKQLLARLQEAKAAGTQEFVMPHWNGKSLETRQVPIADAIAQAKRQELAGWGQVAGSGLLMAAGCTGFAPLAAAGLLVSAGVALASVGAELYVHRAEVKDKLVHGLHVVEEAFHRHHNLPADG